MIIGYDMVYYTIILISYFQSVEWLITYGCLLANLIINPLEFASYLIIVIHELRYLLLVNMNNMKWMFVKMKKEQNVTWKLKLLKLITAPWFSVVVVGIFWLFMLIALTAFIAPSGFSCSAYYNSPLSGARNIFLVCVAAVIVVASAVELLTDVISNYKLKCNIYKYFIVQDVYLYRIEIYTACTIGVLMIIVLVLNFQRIIPAYEDSFIFGTLAILLHSTLTAFPLCLTIIKWVTTKLKKKNESIHQTDNAFLTKLLTDAIGRDLFAEYAKKEWSTENIMLWVSYIRNSNNMNRKIFKGLILVLQKRRHNKTYIMRHTLWSKPFVTNIYVQNLFLK